MLRLFKLSLCALFVCATVATAGCGGGDDPAPKADDTSTDAGSDTKEGSDKK